MSWATIDPRNWVPSWPITSNVVLGKPPRSAVRQKGRVDPLQVAWASGLGVLEKCVAGTASSMTSMLRGCDAVMVQSHGKQPSREERGYEMF